MWNSVENGDGFFAILPGSHENLTDFSPRIPGRSGCDSYARSVSQAIALRNRPGVKIEICVHDSSFNVRGSYRV